MRFVKIRVVALFAAGICLLVLANAPSAASGQSASLLYPVASHPRPIDLGPLGTLSGSTPISVTIVLRLRSPNEAESLLRALHAPGDSQFHRFLSPAEFVSRFGPGESDVAKITAQFAVYNLRAERTTATTLRVTGLPADMERAFAVSLHSYQVPAHGNSPGYTFHAPLSRPTVPLEMSALVSAVAGLDTHRTFHPQHRKASLPVAVHSPSATPGATSNPFGFLTVSDFASLYDVLPLYAQGVTGRGRKLGIVTLAGFTPSDAFAYWNALGLTVDPNRIQIINIDGGPGAPSDESDSIESTLDVEQSGGIAPGAKILVYEAPNTDQGYVDAFAAAVENNSADSLSTSWGLWEWYPETSPVTDPFTGQTVGMTQAFHELFVRAAIQGQSLFAASGDGGAYDIQHDFGCSPESSPDACNLTLSVDNPADDPAITAAGGTTLPGTQEFCLNFPCTPPYFTVTVPRERVWGGDYLEGYCAAVGVPDPIECNIFPWGSGGGVSILFPRPVYQAGISGTRVSEPGQSFVYDGVDYYDLPANYAGRNVPDISFNADTNTGYVVYYTSDNYGFSVDSGEGGTSFVSQQLNGVTALLGQAVGSRLGLLNFPLYDLARGGRGYRGSHPPLRAITDGDNWFYYGRDGYSPAAGLGTLDVANFAAYLKSLIP